MAIAIPPKPVLPLYIEDGHHYDRMADQVETYMETMTKMAAELSAEGRFMMHRIRTYADRDRVVDIESALSVMVKDASEFHVQWMALSDEYGAGLELLIKKHKGL